MTELSVVTDSTDPAELYAAYRDFTARYQRVCDDIDALDQQLRHITDDAEGRRLSVEMSALTADSAVLLGWVSAAFAAYIFTAHGTHTALLSDQAQINVSLGPRCVDSRPRAEQRRKNRSRR